MATAIAFFSTANSFLSSTLSSSSSPSSSSASSSPLTPTVINLRKHRNGARQILCRALDEPLSQSPVLTKRGFSTCFLVSLFGSVGADAAVLEAEDDEELLEKVKRDRKKRLERQGVITSSNKETGYLQDLVYRLSKVGQAIENNDFLTANSVLGGSTDTDWVQKANMAFTKLSSSPEEKTEVDTFNSSLASLISSVSQSDIESSKTAFVASATAFEKWTTLTGLYAQLKGL